MNVRQTGPLIAMGGLFPRGGAEPFMFEDYDWEHPLLEKRCAGTEELRAAVRECAEYARAVWEKEAARHADSFIGSNRSDG